MFCFASYPKSFEQWDRGIDSIQVEQLFSLVLSSCDGLAFVRWLCRSSHKKWCVSISPPLQSGLLCWLALVNRIQQKWGCAGSNPWCRKSWMPPLALLDPTIKNNPRLACHRVKSMWRRAILQPIDPWAWERSQPNQSCLDDTWMTADAYISQLRLVEPLSWPEDSWAMINACCFKLLSLRMVCYRTIVNILSQYLHSDCVPCKCYINACFVEWDTLMSWN